MSRHVYTANDDYIDSMSNFARLCLVGKLNWKNVEVSRRIGLDEFPAIPEGYFEVTKRNGMGDGCRRACSSLPAYYMGSHVFYPTDGERSAVRSRGSISCMAAFSANESCFFAMKFVRTTQSYVLRSIALSLAIKFARK